MAMARNAPRTKSGQTIDILLHEGWKEHFSKSAEEQAAIDETRLLSVFETRRLYRLAQAGKIEL